MEEWISENQMIRYSLLFWMEDNDISREEVEQRLEISNKELREAFSLPLSLELKEKITNLIK